MNRILQVVGGMNRAGAETFLMNVYRKLDKSKIQFDFLVYTDKKQDYEDEIITLGGRVIHMPCSSGFGALKSVRMIKKVLHKYGPYTAVHAHTLHNSAFAMLASKKFKEIKRITHSHNTHNTINPSFIKRFYEKWTFKVIRKRSQFWLACGEEAGLYLFGEEFSKKGTVVNNGVDVDKYFYSEPISQDEKLKLGITDKDLVIGSVARFAPVKNHIFMVEFAKYLQDNNVPFKMLLVGEGDLKHEISDKVVDYKLKDNVLLLGLREDIPNLLKTMDVFFMPSLFEGNPVTLIEAQASGLPCVISDAITEKIDLGVGLISRCSLNNDFGVWLKTIQDAKNAETNKLAIDKAFNERKYGVDSTVNQLIKIYEGNDL